MIFVNIRRHVAFRDKKVLKGVYPLKLKPHRILSLQQQETREIKYGGVVDKFF